MSFCVPHFDILFTLPSFIVVALLPLGYFVEAQLRSFFFRDSANYGAGTTGMIF